MQHGQICHYWVNCESFDRTEQRFCISIAAYDIWHHRTRFATMKCCSMEICCNVYWSNKHKNRVILFQNLWFAEWKSQENTRVSINWISLHQNERWHTSGANEKELRVRCMTKKKTKYKRIWNLLVLQQFEFRTHSDILIYLAQKQNRARARYGIWFFFSKTKFQIMNIEHWINRWKYVPSVLRWLEMSMAILRQPSVFIEH